MWTLAVSEMGRAFVWTLYMPNGTAFDNGKAKDKAHAMTLARASLREERINAGYLELA